MGIETALLTLRKNGDLPLTSMKCFKGLGKPSACGACGACCDCSKGFSDDEKNKPLGYPKKPKKRRFGSPCSACGAC